MQRRMKQQRDTSFSCSRRFFIFIVFQGATQLTKYRASPQTCLSLWKRWEYCPQLYRGFISEQLHNFQELYGAQFYWQDIFFMTLIYTNMIQLVPKRLQIHIILKFVKNYNNITHYCNKKLKWILSKQLYINYNLFLSTIWSVKKNIKECTQERKN